MIRGIEGILLFSEDAKKLAYFYKEKVGLKITFEAVMGETDDMYEFKMKNGSPLYVIHHSKVKGKVREIDNKLISALARMAGCPIDKSSGIYLHKHVGDSVKKGEKIMTLYAESKHRLNEAALFAHLHNPYHIKRL